jgi:DNA invertase Pin-like site-specific DNA recombinase
VNRFVTYKRVSTAEQGRSGLGLEAQTRDIGLFLDTYAEEPWELVGEFVEIESGANSDRPELRKAVELAKRLKATLLVAKLDRLSRKVSTIAAFMDDRRLNFRVATMPHADKFQLHIYAALAEQEREFISLRTKAALREAKARGVKLGGMRDATMKRNAAVQVNANARAEKLARIVRPLREGNATLREIAAALNGAGLLTPRGGQWHPTTVARLVDRLDTMTG